MSETAGGGPWGGPAGGGPGGEPAPWPPSPPSCYVHSGRLAGSVCRRCNRPICPECMTEAPVGWQCRSCVRQGARVSPVRRWQPARPGYGRLGATRVTPMVIGLIVINVVAYIWQMSSGIGFASVNGQPVLANGLPIGCAHSVTCDYAQLPTAVHHGEWYRLITSAFLHANIEHIAFNMFMFAIVGPAVEAELGRIRFIALYLVSALGGSLGSYLLSDPLQLSLGASGAIFGLMGSYFVIARRRGWDTSAILALIVINLLISFTSSGIAWQAHIGGLVVGSVVGLAMTRSGRGWQLGPAGEVALGVGFALVVAAILSLLVVLPPGQVNL